MRVALTTLERANIGGDGFNGAWDTHPFEATLPLAVGYTFVGLALGMGVGALVRRTVPAMGITLAAFVFVRAVLQRFRPHFLPPRTWDDPLGDRGGLFRADPDALIVGRELVDTAGRSVDWSAMPVQCNTADSAEQASACYREAELVAERISYQPSSRVWTFQLIETGIVAALALIAITITWYAVRRRRTIS